MHKEKTIQYRGYSREVGLYLNTPNPADSFIPSNDKYNILVTWSISEQEAKDNIQILKNLLVPHEVNLHNKNIRQEFRIIQIPNSTKDSNQIDYRFEWEIHLLPKSIDGKFLFSTLERQIFD